ncbi:MAG TPA: isocitrate lyase/phosphoenolpyruvate mutase family protein [Ilumatobacteraceae bacterium]
MSSERRERFRALHADGIFVMPNAWDIGSARLLASLGFQALATTSSGFAATLGRPDGHTTFDELLEHAAALAGAVDIPINVDSERMFADDLDGVAANVERIAETGAGGCSIEDWNPETGSIDPIEVAVERVAAAADAASRSGIVLTARAENLIHGVDDLDDTIERLRRFRAAGADALFAPGLARADDIRRVVEATDAPLSVLHHRFAPSIPELGQIGVRRISTGGALAFAAYGAAMSGARELLESGTSQYAAGMLTTDDRVRAFGNR